MPRADPLSRLRRRIDDLDLRLVDLLHERALLVQQVGAEKRIRGAPAFVPERERQVVARATTRAAGVLPATDVRAVVREVIHGARRLQGVHAVAVLGPAGSQSEIAAHRHFGSSTKIDAYASMAEVVSAVSRHVVDAAIVPVHNSLTGGITVARDAVAENFERLRLRETFHAPIEHCLVGRGALPEIDEVVSHPEALRQCARWLDEHLPHAKRTTAISSSAAVRDTADARPGLAAIGSSRAASLYHAPVLVPRMGEPTLTRFWVLVPS